MSVFHSAVLLNQDGRYGSIPPLSRAFLAARQVDASTVKELREERERRGRGRVKGKREGGRERGRDGGKKDG